MGDILLSWERILGSIDPSWRWPVKNGFRARSNDRSFFWGATGRSPVEGLLTVLFFGGLLTNGSFFFAGRLTNIFFWKTTNKFLWRTTNRCLFGVLINRSFFRRVLTERSFSAGALTKNCLFLRVLRKIFCTNEEVFGVLTMRVFCGEY